jgi:hypothetical protein
VPRIWFSLPRVLGIRPGISFALSELTKKPSRHKRGGEPSPAPELAAPAAPAGENIPLHARVIAWIVWGFAIYGFLALVGCVGGSAHAGTCHQTVQSCDDGAYIVTDRHGRKRVYGTPNAGFDRYPGQEGRPVFERR